MSADVLQAAHRAVGIDPYFQLYGSMKVILCGDCRVFGLFAMNDLAAALLGAVRTCQQQEHTQGDLSQSLHSCSEGHAQGELQQTWIPRGTDLSEGCSVGDVAVRMHKLRMVHHIEEFRPELQVCRFPQFEALVNA